MKFKKIIQTKWEEKMELVQLNKESYSELQEDIKEKLKD